MSRTRPRGWPHFTSTLRSTAVTARLGRALGIAITLCFVTGLISVLQYEPLAWLPWPAAPVWIYRVTQGIHVASGTTAIPLILLKLWSVYPNLFRWPAVRGVGHAVERVSVLILVSSTLVQLSTGYANALNWYPFGWDFVSVHHWLAYVVFGSMLLHIGVKLPDIVYGLRAKVAEADVLTEIPWWDNPVSHSNAGDQPAPPTPGISRRGMLAAAGAGIGAVVVTSVGQTVTPLESVGLLAIREPSKGPQGVPVNRTAEQARVTAAAQSPDWELTVEGPRPYTLSLADLDALTGAEEMFPVNCVEGWSVNAHWRGLRLLELVRRAGGTEHSTVKVFSVEQGWFYNKSTIAGPQLTTALLATHLNGERLNLDHGYPLRLIAANRAGVLNTKWLGRITVS